MMNKSIFFLSLIAFLTTPVIAETMASSEDTDEPGKIVFYRPKKAKGAAIRFNIEDQGRPMGSLSNGQVFERTVEPGEHYFSVRGPSLDGQDFLSVYIQPGEVVYIRCVIKWGWPAGRPKFEQVPETEGEAAVSRLR
ncbi:MAG: hypothetical protein AB3N64_05340 [Puniceicoccaceae bacterium]